MPTHKVKPTRRSGDGADAPQAPVTELAMRFNEGKPELSFILDFPHAVRYHAFQSAAGAKKYSLLNWRKGLPRRKILDSLLRHVVAYANGEEVDEDGLPHLGGIIWNANVLAEMHHRCPHLDDRLGPLPAPQKAKAR